MGAEVLTDDTVPTWIVLLIEELLDLTGDLLLSRVGLEALEDLLLCVFSHLLIHVDNLHSKVLGSHLFKL